MKKIFFVCAIICVMLCGCGGVSQEDFDNLQENYNELNQEKEELQSDYNELKQNYESMLQEKSNYAAAQMKLSYAKAWAASFFGDDCTILFSDDNEYMQIVSRKEWNASSDSVKDIWSTMLQSAKGIGLYTDNITQEKIGIKFLQTGSKDFIEFVLKRENNSYVLDSITGDLQNSNMIIKGFENQ